jgi:flagellar protein FlaI
MIQEILILFPCSVLLVGLSGLFTALKNMAGSADTPISSAGKPLRPSASTYKDLPAMDEKTARAGLGKIVALLSEPSWEGFVSFGAVVAIALVSAFILMFVDLPLPAMAGLGIVTLVSAGVAIITLKTRHTAGAWLPAGITIQGLLSGKFHAEARQPSLEPGAPAVASSTALPVDTADTGNLDHHSTDLPFFVAEMPEDPTLATLERYWVSEPYSYVTIKRVGNEGFTYVVSEPPISKKEKTILLETYAHLRDIIIYDETEAGRNTRIDPVAVSRIIRSFDPEIDDDRLAILNYYITRDLSGYGPLETLMRDPALEDISCNGNDLPVFIFHRAYGSLPTSIVFSETELNQFVLKLAQKANKQLSLSNPMVDATLPDGARIQITYSEVVSTKGSSFTIRKFRAEPMTPLDLIKFGTYDARTLAFLWLAIQNRKSLLVVGGTASGKTSMMNAVSLFIPQNAKVVSLEDTREIQLPHKNWLPTQTRELNAEGIKGDIDLFSLLKACMRQRPEFIIVGEVRGKEAQTLFQAMNSGHATLSTIHAGSVYEAINRLTHDPINVPPVMFQALDLVVVQSIYTLGKTRIRRCLSIHEISVDKGGEIIPIPLFEWDVQNDTFRKVYTKSKTLDEIAFHNAWDETELERELAKREEFFSWALEVQPPTLRDLANAIHDLGD